MKICKNCGRQFEGSFCTMCGTKDEPITTMQNSQTECSAPYGRPIPFTVENTNALDQGKTNSLLGFRSNKTWKKVISILYLIECGIFLLAFIFEGKFEGLPMLDFIISKISDLFSFILMISPYIFLSNFKFRRKIPLFNRHKAKSSVVGMVIVVIIVSILAGVIEGFHSDEYKADITNHSYVVTQTIEGTETVQGEIHKQCSFCGKTTIEYTDTYNN